MQAIIIDDEKHCRDVLQMLLNKYCPQVKIVAMCNDGTTALAAIAQYEPNLIFLDVEMPGMDGFELLQAIPQPTFSVVFTTAYNQYAIQAIRHSALDFLLKPIDKDELIQAVQRAQQAQQQASHPTKKVDNLLQFLQQHLQPNERIALPTLDGLRMMPIKEILYCESDGGYTRIFMQQQHDKAVLICRTLKEVEDVLKEKGFFRVHNSYLINLSYIDKYIKGDGGEIVMSDGKSIPVSRNRKQEFLTRIERL
ncbi:LytTR family two component transcriptional regulator [Chitinophaga skermanii]|uniref:LytTR family two component transcriptional regulator n=1 Tax=Chitinophaga skermanii TaxID=331697 RepID=A0A327QAK5_9BACT|nr:LytTR family DNA-binding domain-containing protein [Chitinophaga skermanii]RAJ01569.1 LytTR family two component transcriptional regulator [Chitinophaga skermanii]